MVVDYSVRSHKGFVRRHNEDNLCANGEVLPPQADQRCFSMEGKVSLPCFFAVCDGMGGTDRGGLASFLAVQTLAQRKTELLSAPNCSLKEVVTKVIEEVDTAIRARCRGEESAGTTMCLAVMTRHSTRCFNLGDSRIYFHYKGKLIQVTHDHTWLAEKMENERPLRAESVMENMHKITRCLGVGPKCPVEVYPPLRKKGRLLLCSDGLTDMLSTQEIAAILDKRNVPAEASEALLTSSLDKGGEDNITIIVADIAPRSFLNIFG